jgi:hypothetical protein
MSQPREHDNGMQGLPVCLVVYDCSFCSLLLLLLPAILLPDAVNPLAEPSKSFVSMSNSTFSMAALLTPFNPSCEGGLFQPIESPR